MRKLQQHINYIAQEGTQRSAFLLAGADINMKQLTQDLRCLMSGHFGRKSLKYVWFKVSGGVVLLVSGSKVVIETVESYLGDSGDCQEFTVLYRGHGVKIFNSIVSKKLVDYDQSTPGHSFGASR
ncbi:hypothetical protein [Pseudomonas sp. MWU13-2100]|uniref:hypothetical protein n=1 Tax=Pseudomonas sp. MWU13-2100 TaxID=2935075 RepID=UPI00200FF68C|nr:hypothetical protein [Pseudomonas sp. MWU13-2100]